jgi:hypothetical protein
MTITGTNDLGNNLASDMIPEKARLEDRAAKCDICTYGEVGPLRFQKIEEPTTSTHPTAAQQYGDTAADIPNCVRDYIDHTNKEPRNEYTSDKRPRPLKQIPI